MGISTIGFEKSLVWFTTLSTSPFLTKCTSPFNERTFIIARSIFSTVPVELLTVTKSPTLSCPVKIIDNPVKTSSTIFFAPKPTATPKTPAVASIGFISIPKLPKILVTIGSLIAGMNIGNRIMNKVNNKIFDQKENREVHASDYLVHADDICVAASLLLKDNKSIAAITSKALPASFILAGTKAGSEHAEH